MKENCTYLYELGKWLGDRRGYPRVGIVNTEMTLIEDTKRFLEEHFHRTPLFQVITQKERPTMLGKKAYDIFIVDGRLHRHLEEDADNLIYGKLTAEQSLALLAGLTDADGTIDLKNRQVVISVGKKNHYIKEYVIRLTSLLAWPLRVWDCGKEWKLSIPLDSSVTSALLSCLRHPRKRALLYGEVSCSDQVYLDYIIRMGKIKSQDLVEQFHIHADSARRLLRYFVAVGKLRLLSRKRPYIYVPK